jgi:3-phytase
MSKITYIVLAGIISGCSASVGSTADEKADTSSVVKPFLVSDPVTYDSDDPAIWVNHADLSKSLVIGTDKGGDAGDGALFVFDLHGKVLADKCVKGIKRPNNVDVAYNLKLNGRTVDIAVCTERNTNAIRVFQLPEMKPIDNGGIPVFEGDSLRAPMGLALYTAPSGDIFAIVGRKSGPRTGYLAQYKLEGSNGTVTGRLVRTFGEYSGLNEIEAIAVDNELGYVYYSDEGFGIRKYHAHPDHGNMELATFGRTGFADNHEGISIYKTSDRTGFIVISDQQANQFRIFPREGSSSGAHDHPLLNVVKASTVESDGNEITSIQLPGYPNGLFVAMSDDKTFQFYQADKIIGNTAKMPKQ